MRLICFVRKLVHWKTYGRVKRQMEEICRGFYEVVSYNLVSIFDEKEIELLISGIAEIDIDDWKKNTVYKGCDGMKEPVVVWFWKCVEGFDSERRTRLLQFVTGSSRLPINGFRDLQGSDGPRLFTIEKTRSPVSHLPTSHTCFNRLDLPPYSSYRMLKSRLEKAIENTVGFGIE